LTGLLKGQFDIVVSNTQLTDPTFGDAALTTSQPGGFANGEVRADFVPGVTFSVSSAGIPFLGLRLEGTAIIEISEFRQSTVRVPGEDDGDPTTEEPSVEVTQVSVVPVGSVSLTVDGFRQSATPGDATVTLGGTDT
ncbi:MAG: hypothetical protein ACO1QR_12080, partial [Chthoniobacteraceae bacterium]